MIQQTIIAITFIHVLVCSGDASVVSDCHSCPHSPSINRPCYLDAPRLHFAGRLRADTITLNNQVDNFDSDNFHIINEAIHDRQHAGFSPAGTAGFDFHDTYVTSVCEDYASPCSDKDPFVGTPVYTSASSVSAKLISIDVEGLGAVSVYGMTVALGSKLRSLPVLSARLPTVSSTAEQVSIVVAPPKGHSAGSVRFQTLIEDIEWNDELLYGDETYRFLRKLREAANGTLSVSFTTYVYNVQPFSKNFLFGYVVGTIGPGSRLDRSGSVSLRALQPAVLSPRLNGAAVFTVRANRTVTVDFSNAVTRRYVDGLFKLNTEGMGRRWCLRTSETNAHVGELDVSDEWYERVAGVHDFQVGEDVHRSLRNEYLEVVRCVDNSSFLVESKHYTRAMSLTMAFLNPGDRQEVKVLVTQKGLPLCGHQVPVYVKIKSTRIPKAKELKTLHALKVNGRSSVTLVTDCKGEVTLKLEAGDPGNPRDFVDGCPYNVFFVPEEENIFSDVKLYVRVFDEFMIDDKPTWYGKNGVYNIFRQYYHLFPVMRHVVLLGDYDSVTSPRNIQYIKMAMTRPFDDPGFMPVKRDLSRNKTKMVLEWLDRENRRLSIPPPRGPRGQLSLEELRKQLQLATQIEHYTIPVYLYAFYSIKDGYNNEVREIIRSIFVDEMIHMSLAANILNAIGGSPDFTSPEVIPVYPSRLPGDVHPELTLHLSPLSKHLIKDIFMHIEMPRYLPDDDEDVLAHTIGGFYMRVKKHLKRLEREHKAKGSTIFTGDPARQVEYDMPGHRKIFKVTDLDEAMKALELIVEQGEGSSQVMPRDDHGQLSHYYRFQEIIEGRKLVKSEGQMKFIGDRVDFDPAAVYRFPDNPHVTDYPAESLARKYAEGFSQRYLNVLSQLHRVFNGSPERVTETFASMFYLNMKAKEMAAMEVRVGDSSMHLGPTFENPLNL